MAGLRKAIGRPWWIPAAVQPRQGVLVQTSHTVQLTSGKAQSPKSRRRHVLQHAVAATANLCVAAYYEPCLPMLGRVDRRFSCLGSVGQDEGRQLGTQSMKRTSVRRKRKCKRESPCSGWSTRKRQWMSGARLCPSRGDSVYSCSDELRSDVYNAHGFPVKP